ncbi:MAG: SCP2 sterol-binding domain-containing protein [Spirochaetota bacterium]
MPVFSNTEKMYEILGELFNALLSDATAKEKFLESDIVIQFGIHDSARQIWLLNEDGGKVIYCSTQLKLTIEMTLSGDLCLKFKLQELTMPVALAKGLIKNGMAV